MDVTQAWLTVREVATELQVHEETVRRWIRSGELPAVELGGPRTMYRIRPTALGAFMRQRTHGRTTSEATGTPEVIGTSETVPVPRPPRSANFRQLVEHLPMVTFVFDPGGRNRRGSLLYISPEVEQIVGVSVNDWYQSLDEVTAKLLTPDQFDRLVNLSLQLQATSQHFSVDVRMIHQRTGAPVWVSLDVEADRPDPSGRDVWYGLMVDITERKQMEERLHAQIRTLNGLAARLVPVMNLEGMIFEVFRDMAEVLPVIMARLRIPAASARSLTTYAITWGESRTIEPSAMQIERNPLLLPATIAHRVLEREQSVCASDLRRDERYADEHEALDAGARSAIAVPVRDQVRVAGVLEVFAAQPEAFRAIDQAYLEAAGSIAALALARQGERWLTVPEVAQMFDVRPETVRRWIRQGDLVAAMPGGVRAGYRVDSSQLNTFIMRRQAGEGDAH